MKERSSAPRASPLAARARLLIVDDAPDVLTALRLLLKPEGYAVDAVLSPAAALAAAGGADHDLVLLDLNYTRDTTSGREGLDLLGELLEADPARPVVVMTGWGTVELAVEAMRRGARDFVKKPWENDRLLSIVRNQVELSRALRQRERLLSENRLLKGAEEEPFVAGSRAMQPVLELLARVGPSDADVLVTGENGTGKGLVARRLHMLSARRERPFVTVNLGGLTGTLFESELFGHVKGAFTDAREDRVGRIELADQGTLFLDEIANLSPELQAKLLRVVETRELERVGSSRTRRVDVRLVSATNADLDAEVSAGRFRRDLLFRLNTITLHLPPLRDRREDVLPLAEEALRVQTARYRRPGLTLSEGARAALLAHSWPGNVRELQHTVERAVLMARGQEIVAKDLGLTAAPSARSLDDLSLEEVEQVLIRKALSRSSGNVVEAARALGLSRSALYRRLQKHGA